MFEPNFSETKAALMEKFKPLNPESPFDEIVALHNKTAMDTAEKLLLDYHRQLWAELKRQGVVK